METLSTANNPNLDRKLEVSDNQVKPEKVRVGLYLQSILVPKWIYSMLSDIVNSEYIDLIVAVKNMAVLPSAPSFWKIIKDHSNLLFYGIYARLDERLFNEYDDPFQLVNAGELLSDVPVWEVEPRMKKYSDYLADEDVEIIRGYNLDVMLRLGFRILKGRALDVARYGVWSYHHGDNQRYRGSPAGFWEVMNCDPITGTIVQIINEDLDNGKVIHRSYSRTHNRSVKLNKQRYFWKSARIIPRKLDQLARIGTSALDDHYENSPLQPYLSPMYRIPDNRQMMKGLWKLLSLYAKDKLRGLVTYFQWYIAYRINRNSNDPDLSFFRFQKIIPPLNRFFADPFPVYHDGCYYIFFEDYIWSEVKGYISVIKIDQKGKQGQIQRVLERPYHLSYPFIFQQDDNYYMIPETMDAHRIELYKCREFPDQWELDRVLMENVNAVDTTLIEHDGLWWMFTNIDDDYNSYNEDLYIFYADSPFGPWVPHPMNPVKSDIRNSRPAGRIFRHKDKLYRPAQDSSIVYGKTTVINEIIELSKTHFREKEISRIDSNWEADLTGIHTFNHVENMTVIDCRREYRGLSRE